MRKTISDKHLDAALLHLNQLALWQVARCNYAIVYDLRRFTHKLKKQKASTIGLR